MCLYFHFIFITTCEYECTFKILFISFFSAYHQRVIIVAVIALVVYLCFICSGYFVGE